MMIIIIIMIIRLVTNVNTFVYFLMKKKLNAHVAFVHEKAKHLCQWCGAKYLSISKHEIKCPAKFNKDKKNCISSPQNNIFKSNLCGRTFIHKKNINEHYRRGHGNYVKKCKYCNAEFPFIEIHEKNCKKNLI